VDLFYNAPERTRGGDLRLGQVVIKRVAVVEKLGVNNGSGDGGSCFGVEVWTDTAKTRTLLRGTLRHIIFPCLLLDPPCHLPPIECPRLRFGPTADHARVTNDFILLFVRTLQMRQGF